MDKYDYKGEQFLNRLYKDLHMEDIVMHTANPSDNKDEKVRKYLDRLEKVEELAKNSKYNGIELLKEIYYKKYVIKEENIPESYFELQEKIALDRGFGHITVGNEMKEELINSVITDQKKSLDIWLDYFLSNDAMYPEWFKYYAFQGMLKLGSYDKGKGTFNKRTSTTTNIFVDLNMEALALVYDNLVSVLSGEKVNDEVLNTLLENGSFSKLYAYAIRKLDGANKDINGNDGIWIKYNQGDDPRELVNSLEGKGTGWCTAGYETAKKQLASGDFYVYYTKDSNNQYRQPRIAIRMDGKSKIAEIRGIAKNQNLESDMEKILDEKLEEFPNKDRYNKQVSDMKELTKIYDEYKDRELTVNELKFLYEIDNRIVGFGYRKDPRIEEIKECRNLKKDLASIFNCSEEEISTDKNDIVSGKKIVYYYGELNLSALTSAEGLKLPEKMGGSLDLRGLTSAKDLKLPEEIGEYLDLSGLTRVEGLKLPEKIGEGLYLNGLTSAEGLKLPEKIGGALDLSSLTSAEGLKFPEKIGEGLYLNSLTSAKDLKLPEKIGGALDLGGLTSAKDLKLPEEIGGSLYLNGLTSAKDLKLPEKIGEGLYLNGLTSAEGLKLPEKIGGDLDLGGLTSAKDLKLPEEIGEELDLSSLTSAEGLKLPEKIGEGLYLNSLTSAKDLKLPEEIGEYLDLSGLTRVEGLKLPEKIGGSLDLSSLTSADGLILPSGVEGILDLYKLISLDGIVVPKEFYIFELNSQYFTMDDLLEKSLENNYEVDKPKQHGYSTIFILGLINLIVSIGIIILGAFLSR